MQNKRKFSGYLYYIMIFAVIFIFNSCSLDTDEEVEQLKITVDEYNQEGLRLLEEGEGKEEEALDYFLRALVQVDQYDELQKTMNKENPKTGILYGNVFNNLSLAYYTLEDYDLSLEYIEKALSIEPDTDSEYINNGNVLSSLNRDEEALQSYDKALRLNGKAKFAYYGKGSIYYDQGDNQNALKMFEKYFQYERKDIDANLYYINSLINVGNNEEALKLVNKVLPSSDNSFELLEVKGEILNSLKSYEETELFYQELVETCSDNIEALILLGEFYYNHHEYQLAIDHFLKLTEKYMGNQDLDSWVIYSYEALDDIDNALGYFQEVLDKGLESYQLYNAIGNVFLNKSMYMDSIKYFDKAISLNPEDQDAYINKLYGLYSSKRYTKCLEFAKLAEKRFSELYDIPWYIGDCYFYLSNYEEAITYYKQALALSADNESLLSYIANSYLLIEDYENAEEYMNQCLAVNSENSTALTVQETLKDRQKPINQQMIEIFQENYMYYEKGTEIEDELYTLFGDDNMSNIDIAKAVEELKDTDDIFTYVIHGEDYDYYTNEEIEEVQFSTFDDISYLKIESFIDNTDNKVIEILDNMEDTENKTLVIDLRDNYGGLTDAANNILDVLLSEYVTSTLIDREGYTYNYYSGASQIKFNKIYVLVNEYSISAAELLTLGLKTYLSNVTIICTDTYGKGVGQRVYEYKDRKLMVCVVNHYWNVRQHNIMKVGIKPDIYLESNDLEDYISIIKER